MVNRIVRYVVPRLAITTIFTAGGAILGAELIGSIDPSTLVNVYGYTGTVESFINTEQYLQLVQLGAITGAGAGFLTSVVDKGLYVVRVVFGPHETVSDFPRLDINNQ